MFSSQGLGISSLKFILTDCVALCPEATIAAASSSAAARAGGTAV